MHQAPLKLVEEIKALASVDIVLKTQALAGISLKYLGKTAFKGSHGRQIGPEMEDIFRPVGAVDQQPEHGIPLPERAVFYSKIGAEDPPQPLQYFGSFKVGGRDIRRRKPVEVKPLYAISLEYLVKALYHCFFGDISRAHAV